MSGKINIVCNFGNVFCAGPQNRMEMVDRVFASVFKSQHLKRSKSRALQCLTVYICLCLLQHVCSARNNDAPWDETDMTTLEVHESVHRDTTTKITNKMHYID